MTPAEIELLKNCIRYLKAVSAPKILYVGLQEIVDRYEND